MKKFGVPYFFFLAVLFTAASGFADERILSFHSDITVHDDGSMTVEENIRVRGEGAKIKHGIYRDFPTSYDTPSGKFNVDFSVRSVERDGQAEGFHMDRMANGQRIYFGRANVLLSPGEYTYTFIYDTNRQLGYFKNHDELYWNVTGNGWIFPIDEATATVHLPEQVSRQILETGAYVGSQGSREKSFLVDTNNGRLVFKSTRVLRSYEGMTIVILWPKGLVKEPSLDARLRWFFHDQFSLIIFVGGLFLLFFYYLLAWWCFGKDPQKGTIIPLYSPPENWSPAGMRYLMNMGYDHKALTATILNLAVKGFLTIKEKKSIFVKDYELLRCDTGKEKLTPEERSIGNKLFSGSQSLDLNSENYSAVQDAIEELKKQLSRNYKKRIIF